MVLGITEFQRLKRFDRAYRKLDGQHQAVVDEALGELPNSTTLRPSRNLEKVQSRKDTWAIRVTRGIRRTFEVENGTCILRNVGEHDKILNNP